MQIRSEQEIMKSWQNNIDKPTVSICCTTYNHENYISKAIEGFLMQKTDFPFEILIRDDFSTDKTANVIKQYAEKYPKIIKPLYEKVNTFSKGIKPMPVLYKKAIGQYIALCEGDDYWTDPLKLQLQVEYMKKNEYVSLSFHYSTSVDSYNNEKEFFRNKIGAYFTTEDIIGPWFIPTQSIMFKRYLIKDFMHVYGNVNIQNGDLALQLICSTHGKIGYIDKNMSVYRLHSGGVSVQHAKNPRDSYEKFSLLYEIFNTYTKKEHSVLIKKEKKRLLKLYKMDSLSLIKIYIRQSYPSVFKKLSWTKKILLLMTWKYNG